MFTVAIEGNIGVGKTTLIKGIRNILKNFEILPEPIEEWLDFNGANVLKMFYKDKVKYSLLLQNIVMFTLAERESRFSEKNIVLERSLGSSKNVFAELLTKNGYMNSDEQKIFQKLYNFYKTNTNRSIDLIIYLKCSPSVALQRIKHRNRKEEKLVDLDYIDQVHDQYEVYMKKYTKNHCVKVYNVDEIDSDILTQKVAHDIKDYFNIA